MTRAEFAVLVALLVAPGLAGCTSGASQAPAASPPAAISPTRSGSSAAPCGTDVPASVLPEWARAGFTEPEPSVPFVLGDRGDMAAIVWVAESPLVSPPSAEKNNKILWVARVGASDGPLEIRARQEQTGQTVRRRVEPAPGPSIVDLPAPGCWSLDLRWGTHRDHLQLGYGAGEPL